MIKNYLMIAEMHMKLASMRWLAKKQFNSMGASQKNIILTGPARSGKSILSRRLQAELGYIPFRMDSVGGYARAYSNRTKRRKKMNSIIELILRDIPAGLCVEGSTILRGENFNLVEGSYREKFFRVIARADYLTEDQKYNAFVARHSQIDLAECIRISRTHNAQVVLIGSLEDPNLKARGMLKYRASGKCWSSKYCTDDEIYYLALDNHLCSKRLYELSLIYDLPFIDMESENFEGSIKSAITNISKL